jgi:hypothetical protein
MIIIIRILMHQPLSQPNREDNLLQKATFVKPENKQTINLEERQTMSNVRLLYYGPDVPCVLVSRFQNCFQLTNGLFGVCV